jgi:hypothetical protein
MEDKKQKAVCMEQYKGKDEDERNSLSDIDVEREEECGICLEMNSKVVLPNCTHAMCLRCYQDWYEWSFSLCSYALCDYIACYFLTCSVLLCNCFSRISCYRLTNFSWIIG